MAGSAQSAMEIGQSSRRYSCQKECGQRQLAANARERPLTVNLAGAKRVRLRIPTDPKMSTSVEEPCTHASVGKQSATERRDGRELQSKKRSTKHGRDAARTVEVKPPMNMAWSDAATPTMSVQR